LFYVTTKEEFPPGRTFIPKWRLMTRLLVLPRIGVMDKNTEIPNKVNTAARKTSLPKYVLN